MHCQTIALLTAALALAACQPRPVYYDVADLGCEPGFREQWYGPGGRVVPHYARYRMSFDCIPAGAW